MKFSFLSTFFPFRGGIAQFNALLFREIEKENEIEAITFKRQYPNFLFPGETQMVQDGDKVDEIPAKRIVDSINPLTWFKARKYLRNSSPDVVLTKYWMTFFGPSLGLALKKLNKKTVRISILDNVIPHERRFFDGIANRTFLKNNDGFIVMSDKVLADLLKLKPDAKYLRVNHPLYNHFGAKIDQNEAKEKLGLDPEKKTLLFFGFIRAYKGLDLLLEAFDKLDDSYQLVVAGEIYGDFSPYQTIIDKSPNKHNIHLFNHYIQDDEVSLYYSAADVCILPYKSATQSGITSISYHFELPIIATDVGGLKETIYDGKTGLIVNKAEPTEIKTTIERYFSEGKQAEMQDNIREENKENSWPNFTRKLVDFSKELVKLKH
jgi:glycosyltransferase involved in cell wall biosynthesis|tara:strand:- start:4327 stop:5460 length:1134 start_codon:yes stop_codon:yes gene_type:complete